MSNETKITTPKQVYIFKGGLDSSNHNRPYRLSAIKKNSQLPIKWLKCNGVNTECWHWQYIFIYTDTNELFGFEFGYDDEFVGKVKINK